MIRTGILVHQKRSLPNLAAMSKAVKWTGPLGRVSCKNRLDTRAMTRGGERRRTTRTHAQ